MDLDKIGWGSMTDGQLADLEVSLTEQLARVTQEIKDRRAKRLIRETQAYREAGKLQGFDLLVAERRANGEGLTAQMRLRERQQREIDKAPLEGLL